MAFPIITSVVDVIAENGIVFMGATTIESIVSSDTIWPVVCNIFTTIMEQGFVIVDIVRHIVKQHLRNRQLHPFLPFLVIMGKEEEAKSLGSTIY